MGAHSLGGAHASNSGYSGNWTSYSQGFSEFFYAYLTTDDFEWTNVVRKMLISDVV